MKKFNSFFKSYWSHLSAFFIPFTIVLSIYLIHGIYWGSDTSPLLGDGFHQYVIFDTTLRDILHGSDSLFYSFTSGLGINFYALSSYYLGSFLSPFVYFFNVESMPDSVYLFTLIKFDLIGLSTFISLKGVFKQIEKPILLLLSTCFALMSFATSQIEIKTWLDVFILAPLILYGLDNLINQKKLKLYYVSLTILFIQNYYFGFMMALFLTLWFTVQLSWDFKKRIHTLLDFTVVSILAGITSLIMILPTILDLRTHGETLTKIEKIFSEDSWYLDIFAKNFVGSFDTTKYGSIPMIYVGLIPLVFAVLFFTLKSVKFHVKLSYLVLIAVLVTSFYIQPLDLFWQGMHAPNMFLHRYSWLFSLLILFMAAETFNRIKEIKFSNILVAFILLSTGFIATFVFRKQYDFLNPIHFILTLEFGLAYLIILSAFSKKMIPKRLFHFSLLFFVTFELSLNTFYQIDGIAKEWVFATRSSYAENLEATENLVAYAKKENKTFFRMEEIRSKTGNDSMKYNYNGISQFSSVRNTMASSVLDKLGFKSAGTNLNLRYQNNSILMDSLFGVKYNLSATNPEKYGFIPVKSDGELTLYQNENASSLAILTNDIYKDVKFDNLTLDNQTKFINQLTGLDYKYFNRIDTLSNSNIIENDGRMTVNADDSIDSNFASATYTFLSPTDSQVYLTIPGLTFSNDNNETVDIEVDGHTFHYTTNNVFPFFNVGYFKAGQEVTVRMTFPDNSQVSFDKPEFYGIDLSIYQIAMNQLKTKQVETKQQHHTITADYSSETKGSMIFTLPYDKGWSATLNGEPVAIKKVQGGFMKVDLPAGSGTVKLSFLPQGLKLGVGSFIGGIILFLLYQKLRTSWKIKKKEKST